MANGSKVVRMRDDVAGATEKQTDDEQTLGLDSLSEEARMKKSLLLAKRLEKLDIERESRVAATTSENTARNTLESNISRQIRLDIKAGISTAQLDNNNDVWDSDDGGEEESAITAVDPTKQTKTARKKGGKRGRKGEARRPDGRQ